MNLPNFKQDYQRKIKNLLFSKSETSDIADVMSIAVGGEFETMGYLEFQFLKQIGLNSNSTIVDVGCGSGRLTKQLLNYLTTGKYIGFDVVPELFAYASNLCSNRDNFKIYEAPGLTIPEKDEFADYICFYSVLTHLTHKESFLYLKDAKRVLKHDGKIVISFLESIIPKHKKTFIQYVEDNTDSAILNQFIERSNFKMWCELLNLKIDRFYSGNTNYIEIDRHIKLKEHSFYHNCSLGQSVVVISKI